MLEGKLGIPKHVSRPKSKYHKIDRPLGTARKPITEDTPLSLREQQFLKIYVGTGDPIKALKTMGIQRASTGAYRNMVDKILSQPNIQKELKSIMAEIKDNTIMDAREVMQYFTSVARGEVKDQFGLDAPLTERTKAAVEIAKRTVDIDIKRELQEEATATPVISVKLIRD